MNNQHLESEEEFNINWKIQVTAANPNDAAMQCLQMMRDRTSWATCFEVTRNNGNPLEPVHHIDLTEQSAFIESHELVQGVEYALGSESTLRYEQDATIQEVDCCYTIYKTSGHGEIIDPIAVVQTYSQVELLMGCYGVKPF